MPITCATNPAVGREAELGRGTLRAAPTAKRVVVVGGGPAGLEAAWVAAARGHRVTLLERERELGGKIRLAARPARSRGARRLRRLARRRVRAPRRRHPPRRRGDADDVLALAPDAVVVATGGRATMRGLAKWPPMPVPGSEQEFVLDHEPALRAQASLGRRAS